jgi:hypothetical protein
MYCNGQYGDRPCIYGAQKLASCQHELPRHDEFRGRSNAIIARRSIGAGQRNTEGWRCHALASPLNAAKSTSVILVLNQYKCIECSPGKLPDTRTTATGSDDDNRDSVHDRSSRIFVWPSERPRRYERQERRRAH